MTDGPVGVGLLDEMLVLVLVLVAITVVPPLVGGTVVAGLEAVEVDVELAVLPSW